MSLGRRNLFSAFGITAVGQGLSTLLIAVSGIVLVRLLPTEDYALLAICTTALLTLNALADSGIALAVTNQASKVFTDRSAVGRVIASGCRIRRGFFLATGSPISLILGYILLSHGTSPSLAATYTALTLVTSFAALTTSLGQIPLQLHQHLGLIQVVAVLAHGTRLLLYLAILSVLPLVGAALAIGALTQMAIAHATKRLSVRVSDPHSTPDPEATTAIVSHLRLSVPTSVFYGLTAGLPMWLLSFLGPTVAIAQFGGLTRVISLQAIFVTIFAMVLVPRFARLPDSAERLTRFFVGATALALGSVAAFTAVLSVAGGAILAFLGDEFVELGPELILYSGAGGVSVLYSLIYGLNSARGWLPKPAFLLPTCLLTQVASAWVVAPTSAFDAILLALIMPLPALGFLLIETIREIRRISLATKPE